MSERGQTIIIWWGLIFMYIFGFAWWGLLDMMPPPTPMWTPDQVSAFYMENSLQIRLGAMIASWTAAFMVPFSVAVYFQLLRLEKGGPPVWSVLALVGGITMSMFLVFPPILWGVAAYTPTRPAEVTTAIHEMALLTLTTTDQYYIFQMVAIAYVSLSRRFADPLSPFPRWMGWFTIWAALIFEVGAIAFLPKHGPFAWNGLFVFWFPLVFFGTWVTVMSIAMLQALKRQRDAAATAAG